MQIYYQWFDSPVGNLLGAADDKNLRAAVYEHKIDGFDKVFPAAVDQENEIIATTKKQKFTITFIPTFIILVH